MATREELINQARQEAATFERSFRVMKHIINVWNTLDYTTGLTQELMGTDNADLTPADLGAYVTAVGDLVMAIETANRARVAKSLYTMMRKIDP